jgi:hypothetical protein
MPFILKKYYPARNVFFFLGEGFLIFLAVNGVYYLFRGPHPYGEVVFLYGMRALLVTTIFQLSFYFFDLYDLSGKVAAAEVLARIMQAFGVGCIVLAFVYYFFPIIMISSRVFWTGYGAICASIFLWRFVYNKALDRKMFVQPVVVLGAGELATRIFREIEGKRDSGYKIISFIGSKKNPASPIPEHIPVVAEMEQLPRLCRQHKVEKVVVALDDARGKTPVQELLQCKMQGISIENGVTFYEGLTGKIMVEKVNPSWLIYSSGFQLSRWSTFIKRFLDIVLSSAGLLVSLPVTLISAVIIKLESTGPVFYKQERVGEKGKLFNVIKFRSMRSDAEKDGPVWAMENDTRVTRFGGFIRKVRIDEIPQMGMS